MAGRGEPRSSAAGAHFVLLPTATEGWPRALGEAMAWRAVPLASPAGAVPAVLGAIDPRLLLPRERPLAWADGIERLARDGRLWRRLADRSARQARRFSSEAYLEAVRRFWERAR